MDSPHKSRARKTLKWLFTLTSATLLIFFIASGWYYASWHNYHNYPFQLWKGRITYSRVDSGWSTGWNFRRFSNYPEYRWSFERQKENPAINFTIDFWAIPLWFPLLLTALPTTYLWSQDTLATRRTRKNHCPNCNYDRRGLNPAAACPECNSNPMALRSEL